MLQSVRDWLSKSPNQQSVIQRLNKESVRNHRNLRAADEGGPPASQGSFAEVEAHQLQHAVMGHVPGIGLLAGNAKAVEGGSPGYPSGPGGYPQAEGQQHGGLPGPGYPGGPMGGGGHQHGGGRCGSTSTYTPPAAVPSLATTFPMSSSGLSRLPSPHSGSTGPHTQHGRYAPPSGSPSFPGPGKGGDGFSFPDSGVPSFPSGDGVSFPDSNASSFLGAPSFSDGGYSGPPPVGGYNAPPGPPHLGGYYPPPGPPHHGGYNPPPGPPHHGGYNPPPGPPHHGGYNPPPGPPHHGGYNSPPGPPPHGGDGYYAPPGPPPGFPDSGGYGGDAGPLEFPGANTYSSTRPGGYNPSYPRGDGW